jgi:CHAT domain-containing protein
MYAGNMYNSSNIRSKYIQLAWIVLFLFFIPLEDAHPGSAQAQYDHAWRLFQHGNLADSQREAEEGYKQFQAANSEWSAKFQLLEAEVMLWRGMYNDALRILAVYNPDFNSPEETIRKLAIEATALGRQLQFADANQRIALADAFCKKADYSPCGYVLRTHGILAGRQDQFVIARQYYFESLLFARVHQDRFLEANAALNLSWTALQINHYDEAADWSRTAYQIAIEIEAEGLAQAASGNLGWAYYQLGDTERAIEVFDDAGKRAARLGSIRDELRWISAAGSIYLDSGDLDRAIHSYRQALFLAKQIDSKEDIVNALEDLARASVETGKLDEAASYLDQAASMQSESGKSLGSYAQLTQGMLAAGRQQDQKAEVLFRTIQNDSSSHTTTRLEAGEELALLLERQGNTREAERVYKNTLRAFESARAQLRREDSRLPFAANATSIYDRYIHLLVQEGRSNEALAAADQSRARSLAQGLGEAEGKATVHSAALNPRRIAQNCGATLLFYWLGAQNSYLWTITPAKITLIPLPAQKTIVARVARFRKALLDGEDLQRTGNEDGQALYQLLVAPAEKLIQPAAPVIILADGALSQLSFESLLLPGAASEVRLQASQNPPLHYWIEDRTLLSAPSLELLAAARPARNDGRNLLLLGNPVTPSAEYPSLPQFGFEINQIARHFDARKEAIYAGRQATPAAYLNSNPAQFSYIHFVSHAVASRMDPLDSAIILSASAPIGSTQSGADTGGENFKLYAREITQHPIDARLVTISACYGSGTRSYAGEGLVGLSWAFLRAGARNVIGALWEVSDDSTPRLMDSLYQGLEEGQTPADALRHAKLNLLHSQSRFRAPFYWAAFQLYAK